eukprot:1303970-Rhodomonas_salina.2
MMLVLLLLLVRAATPACGYCYCCFLLANRICCVLHAVCYMLFACWLLAFYVLLQTLILTPRAPCCLLAA